MLLAMMKHQIVRGGVNVWHRWSGYASLFQGCRVSLSALLCFAMMASASAQQRGQPLSIEAALEEVTIGRYDRPALSPDGSYLAFSTKTNPPVRSLTSQHGREVNLLPNGMLSSLEGARMNLLNVATGVTAEVNAGRGSNWYAAFSPQGRQIAFLSDADGRPQVWVADVATGKARRVSDAQVFVKMWNDLDRPVWSKDGRAVFALVASESRPLPSALPETGPLERPSVTVKVSGDEANAVKATEVAADLNGSRVLRTAVERIDIASGERRVLATTAGAPERLIYAYEISPSQKWIAYLTARDATEQTLELYVVSTEGGQPQSFGSVKSLVYDGPAASQKYGSIFHWSPVQDRLTFIQDEVLKVADFTAARRPDAQVLANELGRISLPDTEGTVRLDQVALTPDGKTAVVRMEEKEGLVFAVVPLDGSPAHRVEVVQRPMRFRGLVYADRTTLWQPRPGTFVMLCGDLATGEQIVVQVSMKDGSHEVLTRSQAYFTFVSSVQPEAIAAIYTDARTPTDLYLFDSKLQKRRRLSHVQPALDGLPVGKNVILTTKVPSYDGAMRTLKSAVLLPAGYRKGQALPALVHFYPDSEMSRQANQFGGGRLGGSELAHFWVSRGYAVVLVDTLPLTPGVEGGGNLIREIRDYLLPQLYHAAQLGYIDIERLVLSGHSSGGYGTAAVLTETSLFRAGVAYSPGPLDWFSTTHVDLLGSWGRMGRNPHPWSNWKQYLTNSPYSQTDKIRTPLLLVHGSQDRISPQASELMFQGLQQLGKNAQLALYEGEPHSIAMWSRNNAVDAIERVLEFVDRHTKVAP
jgi:dipeptidyl aminopeptidase/acylaminoacyl peptidase